MKTFGKGTIFCMYGFLLASCTKDGQMPPDETANIDMMMGGCTANEACGAGHICQTATGRCVVGCSKDTDCSANHVCDRLALMCRKPLFQSAVMLPSTGNTPYSLVVADFNSDQRLDLAIAGANADFVRILLGDGSGGFGAASDFKAGGGSPWSMAAGDFNRDGRPDLVTVNAGSKNVGILIGKGDGSFTTAPPIALNFSGTFPSSMSVVVTDFDNDGKPDLAVAASFLYVFMGLGDGSFAFRNPAGGFPADATFLTTGDFNGDQKADLVVNSWKGDATGTIGLMIGKGDGTFDDAISFSTGNGGGSPGRGEHQIAVGDFNGDNKPDLAVTNLADDNVSILLANGLGSFAAARRYSVGQGSMPVALADINGDHILDVVVGNIQSNQVSVLLGKGDGTFADAINFPVGVYPQSLAIGDYNGDSKPDIAVANQIGNYVSLLLSQ